MTDNQNETNGANSGWSLHFERDGTEDIAVICDAAGDEIARSRPFWLPYADDPAPPTLSAMRLMHAAPRLLAAVEGVIDYAESEAFCLDKLKDSPEAEAEAERAWKAVEHAQAVIAAVKTGGIEDCEGEKMAALVDVAGDEEYRQSVMVYFEDERVRKAGPALLAALEDLMQQFIGIGIAAESRDDPDLDFGQWAGTEGLSFAKARTAIAEAKTAGILPASADIDIHGLLAERRQIAVIWSVKDVRGIRPDLTEEPCWKVLQEVDRHQDAELCITWLTLELVAEDAFGDAPETGQAEEA